MNSRPFSFIGLAFFLVVIEGCAPTGFNADVGIDVRTRSLALDSGGAYRATDGSPFLPDQLHDISSLCLMVNVTGDGIAPTLPGEGSATCSDPKTYANFPGIGKISSFIDGENLSASSASVSVPIGTRTIDLIGFEKDSFPDKLCPSGSIEIKGPNGDAPEMFANGVQVHFNLYGGGPYLFARKAASIVPGDNNIVLEVQKASNDMATALLDGRWAGKDYGCGGGDNYPQIEYAKAYYYFDSASSSSTVHPTDSVRTSDVLRPTLKNFESSKDHCVINIQAPGALNVAYFLLLDPTTCAITVSGNWPEPDVKYIQVGVNVIKENGKQNYAEIFIFGPDQSPGILNVAKVFSAGADGSSPVEFKKSRRGDFYSGISAKNLPANPRFLYVVLENLGSGVASFTWNGPDTGASPSFESLIVGGEVQPQYFGGTTTTQPCADKDDASVGYAVGSDGGILYAWVLPAGDKCYLRYAISNEIGSAWLELNNNYLSGRSVVWPILNQGTIALRSSIYLRIF